MRLLLTMVLAAAAAFAQGRPQFRDWKHDAFQPVKTRMACEELKGLTGYEFSVTTAEMAPAGAGFPEHCRITGQVLPEVRFELHLPTAWNGRLYMLGNGGFAGTLPAARMFARDNAMQHGFAVTVTDTGHDAAVEPVASFAVSKQKVLDYAFRAVHVTVLTARQLLKAYYAAPLTRSYFDGCSTGGRQALMSAQRFPGDFDGILAGAPVLNFTGTMLAGAWNTRALQGVPLPPEKVKLLAERIYAACDAKDGLADGVIDDPRRCGFTASRDLPKCEAEPSRTAGAAASESGACFTAAQIAALEKIYGGVVSGGKTIFPGLPVSAEIAPPGGVTGWNGWVIRPGGPTTMQVFSESFFKYMAFAKPDPAYDAASFNFDADPPKLAPIASFLDATDPDLRHFQARGGKLLMYFGWADPALYATMGVNYYEKVMERMGPSTTDFFRLFMVPGMFHCGGGVGAGVFDAMTPLIDWVEKGAAPARIIGSRTLEGKVRTRPLCPYPRVARYQGSGSIDDASSFACAEP